MGLEHITTVKWNVSYSLHCQKSRANALHFWIRLFVKVTTFQGIPFLWSYLNIGQTLGKSLPELTFSPNSRHKLTRSTHIQLTFTLTLTTAQVVKTVVAVNNSPVEDYAHLDEQTLRSFVFGVLFVIKIRFLERNLERKLKIISLGQITVAVWWGPTVFTQYGSHKKKGFPGDSWSSFSFYFISNPNLDCKCKIIVNLCRLK